MAFNLFSGDPQSQAMLALTSGLLESAGPSRMPVGLGQGVARGMLAGREAFEQARQMEMKQKFFDLQMQQQQQAQMEAQRKKDALGKLAADPRFAPFANLLAVDPQAAIKAAYPEAKVVGNALVNPAAPQTPLFQAPEKHPASVQEYEFARKQGYKGSLQDFLIEQKKAGATQVTQSVGGKETDKSFAPDFVAFATGGFADTEKQLGQLNEVIGALEKEKDITGPVIGNLPQAAREVAYPRSVAMQDRVMEVGQRNLRLILGAQFTAKEGEELLKRTYNPALPQEENAKRVKRLFTQIKSAADAKLEASRYFMAHGTLEGWKGKLWTMKDFDPDGGADATKKAPTKGEIVDGWEFLGGDPSKKINWRKK